MSWHTNRYVRLAGATVAVAVILSSVTPPATASAAAVNDRRNPAPSPNNPPPRRDVPDARQKTTPGSAAPTNPDPAHSQQETAPPPSPVTEPKPVQRKDRPPDRSAHKYAPKRKPAANQQRRNKNNKRRQETRERPDTPATAPGTAPTPQEAFQRGVLDPINNFLRRLAGQPRLPTAKETNEKADKAPARKKKRQARRDRSGCGSDGCLTIETTPERPKPKPKPKIRALDNRKVVDKAEEELRKWQGIDAEGKTKYGIWYGGENDALADWCARFVSYVFAEAGYPLPDMDKGVWDKKDTGFQLVAAGEAWARKHGWFHEGTAGIQPGDIVIYNWPHTGIATSGTNPDGTVDVIEGNTAVGSSPGNEMAKQHRVGDINGQPGTGQIKGFIRPPTNTNLPGHLRARPGERPFR